MSHRRRSPLSALCGAFLIVAANLAGCGGGGSDETPDASNVGPSGATISSADGKATLEVPAGALDNSIQVGLTPVTDGFKADPQILPGTTYRLDTPDTVLATPATLSIALPADSASSTSSSQKSRAHRLSAVLVPRPGLIDCEPGIHAGDEVPPGTVCRFRISVTSDFQTFDDPLWDGICPPELPRRLPDETEVAYGFNFPLWTTTFGFCSSFLNQLALMSIQAGPIVVGPGTSTAHTSGATLTHLVPGIFGLIRDVTPPTVQLTATVTPTSAGMGTLTLDAVATDDIRIASVNFRQSVFSASPPMVASVALATVTVPPYRFVSAEMPLSSIYGGRYAADAYDGAGNTAHAVKSLPALPTIASFTATPATLPVGGGNVTLAWTTTAADTLSIDQGVGIVTGGSIVVAVTANTTFTLTATNATVPVTAQVAVTVTAGSDRFVDLGAGLDSNPCTQAAPCQTIAKAIMATPAGSTVYLADGVYPSTQGPITLPDRVGLQAIHPGAATLAGITVNVAGSSSVRDVVLDLAGSSCGRIVAQSTTGTPQLALDGVLIRCPGALLVGGNVATTMTPGALPAGVYTKALPNGFSAIVTVQGNATLLVKGGTIDGNGLGVAAYGGGLLNVLGSASLTLSGVTMQNRTGTGIAMANTATLLVKDGSVFDKIGVAGNCPEGSVIVIDGAVHVTLDHVQINHSPGTGVCVRTTPQTATISLTATTMNANYAGIASEIGPGAAAVLTASGLVLTGNSYGINWAGSAGSAFDIADATVTGNGIGVQFSETSGTLKLRGSTISGNTDVGLALFTKASVDLGTQVSPGLNTIAGNANVGVKANLSAGLSFTAVGNTWNASAQGADVNGRYSMPPAWTPVTLAGPTPATAGINVSMPAGVSASL